MVRKDELIMIHLLRTNQLWLVSHLLKTNQSLFGRLEVPQLMDTAVRNDYYDEALELAAFAKKVRREERDSLLNL